MTDIIRTIAFLLGSEQQDGQVAGSFTLQKLRDLTVTLQTRSWRSVKQDDAKGDGSTDDTNAFVAALATMESIIFVPDGTYITTGITMSNIGQTLFLAPGATLKAKAGTSTNVINITAAGVTVLGGGTVDGNRANVSSSIGILISGVARVTVQNISALATTNAAIYGIDCNSLKVADCYVTNTGQTGIYAETTISSSTMTDVEFVRNLVDRSAEAAASISEGGIKVHATASSSTILRTKIIDNRVLLPVSPTNSSAVCIEIFRTNKESLTLGNSTSGGFTGISYDTPIIGSITGNVCYNASTFGIENAGGVRCIISGNAIEGNALTTFGIEVNDNSGSGVNHGNAVTGNAVQGVAGHGIRMYKAFTGSVTGNTVRNTISTNTAIQVIGSSCLSISGGELDGVSTSGSAIGVQNSSNVAITGVAIHDWVTSALSIYSDVASTWDNIIMADCALTNYGGVAVVVTLVLGAIGNNIAVMNCMGVLGATATNGNARRGSCLDWKNQVWDFIGSGSPSSSVTAGPGSTYRNQAGGTSTTMYVKESGTGTTVWVAK